MAHDWIGTPLVSQDDLDRMRSDWSAFLDSGLSGGESAPPAQDEEAPAASFHGGVRGQSLPLSGRQAQIADWLRVLESA
jgi:hypothetical protein